MKHSALYTILVASVCSVHAIAQSSYASLQVPKQIQYQGRVATGTGAAWTGTEGYFSFALVQGATVLWDNWEGAASPSDPGAVSLGAGQVVTLPVTQGVFSVRLGEGSDINEQIPPTVFFDTVANSVRAGVKLAVWFSPDGATFTRLNPDVDFTSVPFSMVSGIAEAVKERGVTTGMLGDGSVTTGKIAPETVDALSSSLVQTAPVPTFTAMENLAALDAVAVVTDGSNNARLKKASSADGSRSAFYGFAESAVTTGQPVAVHQYGPLAGFSGLVTGQSYYVAPANGTISTSGGVAPIYAGHALSSSLLFVDTFGVTKRWGTSNYWGDGSDGAMNTTGNVSLASVQDGDVVVKQYTNLTINAGHTLTTQTRCRGLVIYVNGDCTINGTLSMTARGANVDPAQANSIPSTGIRLVRWKVGGTDTLASSDLGGTGNGGVGDLWRTVEAFQGEITGNGQIYVVSREGGSGGTGPWNNGGETPGQTGGIAQSGTGGGASGGVVNGGRGGNGAAGTCYSGRTGGGGAANNLNAVGNSGASFGGAGGNGTTGAGGGAGNPGGGGSGYGTNGATGTGGLMVLLVRGNLTIGNGGSIESKGSAGGAVQGGSSGGGRILILHGGTYTAAVAPSAAGGARETVGGAGAVTIDQINP